VCIYLIVLPNFNHACTWFAADKPFIKRRCYVMLISTFRMTSLMYQLTLLIRRCVDEYRLSLIFFIRWRSKWEKYQHSNIIILYYLFVLLITLVVLQFCVLCHLNQLSCISAISILSRDRLYVPIHLCLFSVLIHFCYTMCLRSRR